MKKLIMEKYVDCYILSSCPCHYNWHFPLIIEEEGNCCWDCSTAAMNVLLWDHHTTENTCILHKKNIICWDSFGLRNLQCCFSIAGAIFVSYCKGCWGVLWLSLDWKKPCFLLQHFTSNYQTKDKKTRCVTGKTSCSSVLLNQTSFISSCKFRSHLAV